MVPPVVLKTSLLIFISTRKETSQRKNYCKFIDHTQYREICDQEIVGYGVDENEAMNVMAEKLIRYFGEQGWKISGKGLNSFFENSLEPR